MNDDTGREQLQGTAFPLAMLALPCSLHRAIKQAERCRRVGRTPGRTPEQCILMTSPELQQKLASGDGERAALNCCCTIQQKGSTVGRQCSGKWQRLHLVAAHGQPPVAHRALQLRARLCADRSRRSRDCLVCLPTCPAFLK